MKNASELRSELSKVFTDLRAGSLDRRDAEALSNVAGKMISSAKVQVDYAIASKKEPKIAFLEE